MNVRWKLTNHKFQQQVRYLQLVDKRQIIPLNITSHFKITRDCSYRLQHGTSLCFWLCSFVYASVFKISQKVADGCGWKIQGWLGQIIRIWPPFAQRTGMIIPTGCAFGEGRQASGMIWYGMV